MIDSTDSGVLSAQAIVDALRARGFRCEIAGAHVVATRDHLRVVVPEPGRVVPPTFSRRLEYALRSDLGPGWLTADPDAAPSASAIVDPDDVMVLDAVVDQCPDSGAWCSFLTGEFSVMGTGATRDDALRDLKQVAALWLGLPARHIALMTPEIV